MTDAGIMDTNGYGGNGVYLDNAQTARAEYTRQTRRRDRPGYFQYPPDQYRVGFVVFDYTKAGRSNPIINPPAVAATFVTKLYNPATDY